MIRKGCIYIEEQRNLGKGREQNGRGTSGRLVRGVGFVGQTKPTQMGVRVQLSQKAYTIPVYLFRKRGRMATYDAA
jgi:hypothetical protein